MSKKWAKPFYSLFSEFHLFHYWLSVLEPLSHLLLESTVIYCQITGCSGHSGRKLDPSTDLSGHSAAQTSVCCWI